MGDKGGEEIKASMLYRASSRTARRATQIWGMRVGGGEKGARKSKTLRWVNIKQMWENVTCWI